MYITPIQKNYSQNRPQKTAKIPFQSMPEQAQAPRNKSQTRKAVEMLSVIAGTAIATTFLVKGKYRNSMNTADHWKNKHLDEEIKKAQELLKKQYEATFEKYKKTINDLLEEDTSAVPKDKREKIAAQVRTNVDNFGLDYDPMTPPLNNRDLFVPKGVELPNIIHRNLDAASQIEYQPPHTLVGNKYTIEMPHSYEINPSRAETKRIKPQNNVPTSISEDYAGSVQWGEDKTARDILQNIYDGNGQTLDGTKMVFTNNGASHTVRVEGLGNFSAEKAILLGESTKRGDSKSAGNFGVGLKDAVLKLLKDYGAPEVKIGSDNWAIKFKLQDSDLNGKRVLGYSIEEVPKLNGNYFEFETNNPKLVAEMKNTLNRFYHSNNIDFKNPDFENDVLGIKYLGPNKKGCLYIAGQRFEVNNDWEGLDGLSIFIKEKPPKTIREGTELAEVIFDPGRDRGSLNAINLEKIFSYIANYKSTEADTASLLSVLKPFWKLQEGADSRGFSIIKGIINGAWFKDLKIKFPEKYIASPPYNGGLEWEQDLIKNGCEPCFSKFSTIGMKKLEHYIAESKTHKALMPDAVEIKKIGILRDALDTLSPYLEDKNMFTASELKPKIYLFERQDAVNNKHSSDTLGQALVTRDGESLGYWIDRPYLKTGSFSELLGTSLHELTHKIGGDQSEEFSYLLTDVLKQKIKGEVTDELVVTKLKALNKLWDELN